ATAMGLRRDRAGVLGHRALERRPPPSDRFFVELGSPGDYLIRQAVGRTLLVPDESRPSHPPDGRITTFLHQPHATRQGAMKVSGSKRSALAGKRLPFAPRGARPRLDIPVMERLKPRRVPVVVTSFTPVFSTITHSNIAFSDNTVVTAPASDPSATSARN